MGVEDLDAFLTGIGKARHEVQALRQDMVQTGVATKGIPLQSRDLRKVSDATLENARAQAKYRDEITKTDRDVGTLKGSMGGLAKAAAGVVVAYAGWQTINKSIQDGIANLKVMGTLGVIFDGPKSQVDALERSFDALARRVGIADDALVAAATDATRLGVAPDALEGVVGQTAKTTQATYGAYGDINTILQATARTANTYGLPLTPENASRIQNILFQGVRAGASSFGEIGDLIGQRGKGLESVGIGMEDVPALLATLNKRGLRGQEALGAIQTMFGVMEKAPEQTTEYAAALGLPWNMREMQSRGLGQWLKDMDRALKAQGGDTSQIMARLGVEPNSANALLSMIAGAGEFEALRTSMRGGADLIGPAFAAWERSPLAFKDRMDVVKGQGFESLGMGFLGGIAGANADTAIDKLVDVQPKLNEFGDKLGAGASLLLDAALHLSGVRFGPDGKPTTEEGTNWWPGIGAVAGGLGLAEFFSRSKVLKGLWSLAKPIAAGVGGYFTGLPWAFSAAASGSGIGASIGSAALLPLKGGAYGTMAYLAGRGALEEGRMIGAAGQDPGFIPGIDSFEVFGFGDRDVYRVRQDMLRTQAEAQTMSLEILKNWKDTLGDMAGAVADVFNTNPVVQALRDQLDEWKQRQADEKVLNVNVEIDHQQRIEFGDPTTKNKTGVRAKKGGAGRAEIHTGYRFFQVQNGTGVHAVRPMPENAIFSHVRRGYN